MKVKEESEKVGLKLNIQKTKIMASGPITSCQIDGEAMGTVREFIFGGSKITADGDCSYEIKRCLLLGRQAVRKLNSLLKKQRHYVVDKGPSSQSYVFPVVVYGCETWTVKKLSTKELMLLNCGVGEDSWELPDVKNWLICKDPDAGNDWRQEEKGMTEDWMVGWHHQLNGHGFE